MNELKHDAECVVAFYELSDSGCCPSAYGPREGSERLAKHYLHMYDETPVTFNWLNEVNAPKGILTWDSLTNPKNQIVRYDMLWNERVTLYTRGEVRRFCDGININWMSDANTSTESKS